MAGAYKMKNIFKKRFISIFILLFCLYSNASGTFVGDLTQKRSKLLTNVVDSSISLSTKYDELKNLVTWIKDLNINSSEIVFYSRKYGWCWNRMLFNDIETAVQAIYDQGLNDPDDFTELLAEIDDLVKQFKDTTAAHDAYLFLQNVQAIICPSSSCCSSPLSRYHPLPSSERKPTDATGEDEDEEETNPLRTRLNNLRKRIDYLGHELSELDEAEENYKKVLTTIRQMEIENIDIETDTILRRIRSSKEALNDQIIILMRTLRETTIAQNEDGTEDTEEEGKVETDTEEEEEED